MDPIGELNDANSSLNAALDRYIQACAALPNHYDTGGSTAKILVDIALSELTNSTGYEKKLAQAKMPLWRLRNQSTDLVPISTLPFEVMSHTFWLSWVCPASTEYGLHVLHHYPIVLLQVCSRWRQIALASPNLWSHIDLDFSSSLAQDEWLTKRADLFATRSKETPLEIHIKPEFSKTIQGLEEFCTSVAPRLQSLELETWRDLKQYFAHGQSWLIALVSGATPGAFTQLRWKSCIGTPNFLVAVDSVDIGRPHIRISVAEERLEEVLFSVTSLHLEKVYPFWTSRAYYGLVELTLTGDPYSRSEIKCLELEGILRASPGLQKLRFGLDMVLEEGVTDPRVELNNLKSLSLTSRYRFSQKAVLHMIHLRQTPLKLTINATKSNYSTLASSSWVQFNNFVARSNITLLHIQGAEYAEFCWGTNFDPVRLLRHLPQLEVLILDSLRFGQLAGESYGSTKKPHLSIPIGYNPSQSCNRLRLLHMIKCVVIWTDLLRTLEMRPIEKLVLDRGWIFASDSDKFGLETVLRRLGPVVEVNETKLW